MYYCDIFKALNESKAGYLVAGGLAVNLHGVPRVTMDLDIMIEMTLSNIKKVTSEIMKIGYKPKLPVNVDDLANPEIREEWIKDRNLIAFSLYLPSDPSKEVDIIIASPFGYADLLPSSTVVVYRDIQIPVVGLYQLIEMKKISGRPQDRWDMKMLSKVRELGEKYG